MASFRLNRRTLLRGAGVALGLPVLEAMLDTNGTALAGGSALPKHFLVCLGGTSLGAYDDPVRNLYVPDTIGANYDLKAALAPLADYNSIKDEISVVSGLRIPWAAENGGVVPPGGRKNAYHAGVPSPLLSGVRSANDVPDEADGHVYGETSEQIVGAAIGAGTAFPSLAFSVQPATYSSAPVFRSVGYMSYRRQGNAIVKVEPIRSPRAAFESLFAGLPATDPAEATRQATELRRRKSVLDLVLGESDRLAQKLGATDRRRLDQHLGEIRLLEERILREPLPVASICQRPPMPGDDARIGARYSGEDDRARIFVELVHMAFACDLTRAASLMFTYFSSYLDALSLPGVGLRMDLHGMTHNTGEYGTAGLSKVIAWQMTHFGRLISKFRDTPEGAGNMLDHSAIVFLHEGGHGRGTEGDSNNPYSAHSTENMAALIAGRAGGLQSGAHVVAPAAANHPANVTISAMRALGVAGELGEVAGPIASLFS